MENVLDDILYDVKMEVAVSSDGRFAGLKRGTGAMKTMTEPKNRGCDRPFSIAVVETVEQRKAGRWIPTAFCLACTFRAILYALRSLLYALHTK